MHTVCDIRDLDLRTRSEPRDAWREYVSQIRALMDSAAGGGPAPAAEDAREAAPRLRAVAA